MEKISKEEMYARCNDLVSYFNENYLNQWIEYFHGESKKFVWNKLIKMGVEHCCLATFYKYTRAEDEDGMSQYYKRLITIGNMPTLIKVLHIQDDFIDKELPELFSFDEEQRRKRYNEVYAAYRKRI